MNASAGRRILVVEDNRDLRHVIAHTLEVEGFQVWTAPHGKAALEVLQAIIPDLILSDIQMPVMNGLEFCKAVRNDPRLAAIPFIFLTSAGSREDIMRGKALGVEDYLIKPIDPDDLITIVNARMVRAMDIRLALVNQAYLDTVRVLANTIEGRDPYTRGHVDRVSAYAMLVARALKWDADQLRWLQFGAVLHDIGKIIVPDQILKKAGPLSDEEWKLMRQHTVAGARIIASVKHLRPTLPYILYHHERWDGQGYPKGLKGAAIPIQARLLTLADVYDALTTRRPYHPARSHEEVIQFIHNQAGKMFDPQLALLFIRVLNRVRQRAKQPAPLPEG